MKVAVYPGSFDPITSGHLDVVRRAASLFDRVVVAVLINPRKDALLSADERIAIIRGSIDDTTTPEIGGRIDVAGFDGLTVAFCRSVDARWIVRGLRAISDFEAEIQLAHNNHRLAPEIDTLFFPTAIEHGYVSSSLVKEIARFGGDVDDMVPPRAAAAMSRAFGTG
jgi:pantetheine-phosphate adenylyltransferase